MTRAIAVALSAGVAGLLATPMTAHAAAAQASEQDQAQAANAQELKGVIVTGSHIRRVDMETANPVLRVGHDQIEATGALTIGELMQHLPAMTGGALNPQDHTSGDSYGTTHLSMRGLGPKRTLILVDGRRVLSSDVSSIPVGMIDHIEVLKNGASAVYGSDAIGGVVNFITKKHFAGAQISGRFGQTAHADNRARGFQLTVGQAGESGSIIAGVGWSKTDGVDQNQRDFSSVALQLSGRNGQTEVSQGGSSNSPYGNIQLPSSGPIAAHFANCDSGHVARNPGASGLDPINDYHCYQNSGPNSDKYNYYAATELLTPQQRTKAFLLGNYHLTGKTSVYLDAYYTKLRSKFHQAPNTFHTPGVKIAANNYWNPFGVNFGPQGNAFRSRTVGLGNRKDDNSITVAQIDLGFKGTFNIGDKYWQWNVGMNYGHEHLFHIQSGLAQVSKLYMGPSFKDPATGKIVCGTPGDPIANCDASFNPFNQQSANSIAALERANVHTMYNSRQQQKIWHAMASGGIFDLPAGTVQLAVGVDYRKQHYSSQISPLYLYNPITGSCDMRRNCSQPISGGFNVKEAYGELFIPILAGVPGAYGLNVTIGDRYSKFSSFGNTNNMEFKVEWRPIQDLLLRGSVEEVFRAPDIGEVFGPLDYTSPYISSDPCDGYTGNPVDPACVNVPTDGSFVNQSVAQAVETSIHEAGSKIAGFPIKPETGKSFDIGAVYSPSWLSGLTVSADVWHVYLNDIITEVGIQNLLNLCSQGQTIYCPFIKRFPSGPQQGQLSIDTIEPTGNMGRISTGGIDFSVHYILSTHSLGRFEFNLDTTYLKYYDAKTAPNVPVYHFAGHYMPSGSAPGAACPGVSECLFPRWRAIGGVMWHDHDWSATWKFRYVGDFRMGSPLPSQDVHPAGRHMDGFYIDYGTHVYHDVTVSYTIEPLHSRVSLGVNNLFDKQPPILYSNNVDNGNTDAFNFDQLGRSYWIRWTATFK
ncbi:MAG TPA: TonB-dependent receptor [Oleiagrimonas sp.]|nr:TonB-dependent receptor [Oleiagrimonas sp.]